ncbi:MAG: hypothetical protein ACRYHQ_31360, partial [Janthinobacterium lividum]
GSNYESFVDATDALAAVREAAAKGEPLIIGCSKQPGGEFEIIEGACRELGLSYLRADDGHYAYPPAHAAYHPEIDEQVVEAAGNIEQGPCLLLSMLTPHLTSAEVGSGPLYHLVSRMQARLQPPGAIVLEDEAAEPWPDGEGVECDDKPEAEEGDPAARAARQIAVRDALLCKIAEQAFDPAGDRLVIRDLLFEAGYYIPAA